MFYATIDKVIGCYEYKQQRFLKEKFLIRSIDIAISIWHKTIVYIYEWLLPTFWSDICHSFNTHTNTYWASYLLVDINVHQADSDGIWIYVEIYLSGKPNEMKKRDCNKWWLSHTISWYPWSSANRKWHIWRSMCWILHYFYFFPGDYWSFLSPLSSVVCQWTNMRFIIWKFMYINILFSVCEKIRISNFLLIFIHWNTFDNIWYCTYKLKKNCNLFHNK